MTYVQWAGDHVGFSLTEINPLLTNKNTQKTFYVSVPSDLDL